MEFKRITDSNSEDFKKIWKIYQYSFPSDEKRTLKKQSEVLHNNLYNLLGIYHQNQLMGFIATWKFKDFIFNEHVAVEESLRGKGHGTKIMKKQLYKNNKQIVLEVERPGVNINAKRRIKFYEKLGFKLNTYNYVQPPYDKTKKPVPLFLMTYPREISKSEFVKIRNKIHTTVYGLATPLKAR